MSFRLCRLCSRPGSPAGCRQERPINERSIRQRTRCHAPSSEGSKYVGAETCKTCHEEIYNAWEKTPHWKTTLNKDGGPSHQGCEGCHGPGADHVAGGGDKTKIFTFKDASRQETSARCLSCHGEAHEQSHFRRIRPLQQRCRLSRLPLSPSRQGNTILAGPEPAPVVLRMPYLGQVGFRQTLSPPRQRGPGAMQRLPQPSRDGDHAPGASAAQRRCRLLQVPCRQARALRLRACAGEDRGLQRLPHAPRFHQSPAAQGEPGEHALPAMPHFLTLTAGASRARAQSIGEISGLHHVSQPDSWVQLQQCLFQVRENRWRRQENSILQSFLGSSVTGPVALLETGARARPLANCHGSSRAQLGNRQLRIRHSPRGPALRLDGVVTGNSLCAIFQRRPESARRARRRYQRRLPDSLRRLTSATAPAT